MRSLTCIVCPMGCPLKVEEGPLGADGLAALTVTGNNCSRGPVYAEEEIRDPKRVVTATCAIAGDRDDIKRSLWAPQRVPVKTLLPCPKDKIQELLADIYKVHIRLPVKPGDLVITDWRGTGIHVATARGVS